jgi:NifU-like protein involved in Fe-S cluster formation
MTTTALPTTTLTAAENELYQDVVIEHKRAPRHYGHLSAPRTRRAATTRNAATTCRSSW